MRPIDAEKLKNEVKSVFHGALGLTVTGAVHEIIDRQPTLTPPNEWISVKERLPETGTVLATDGAVVITAPASSVTEDGPAITHWMPLPEPPEEEKDGR